MHCAVVKGGDSRSYCPERSVRSSSDLYPVRKALILPMKRSVNSLPDGKILALTKLKAFTYDKFNLAERFTKRKYFELVQAEGVCRR